MPFQLTTDPGTAALPLPKREPAVLLGSAQGVLAAALTLAAYWWPAQLGPGLQAAILAVTAAVLAAVGARKVRPFPPALFYGVVQALVPLVVLLGLDLPAGADAAILALAAAGLGVATRGEVSPAAAGRHELR